MSYLSLYIFKTDKKELSINHFFKVEFINLFFETLLVPFIDLHFSIPYSYNNRDIFQLLNQLFRFLLDLASYYKRFNSKYSLFLVKLLRNLLTAFIHIFNIIQLIRRTWIWNLVIILFILKCIIVFNVFTLRCLFINHI